MPDSNGLTILGDLPDAVLFGEILVRLPAKDVFRCRAVHKSWHSGTSTTSFMSDHHRRQPKLPMLFIFRLSDGDSDPDLRHYVVYPNDARIGTVNQKARCVLPPCEPGYLVFLHAARDGLVIVSYRGVFWVHNPATHQVAQIPQLCSEVSIVGFYRHHSTREYRVLYWHHSTDVYSIITLGSDAPPRCIRHPPPSPSQLSQALTETLPYSFGAVLHRDHLHYWYETTGILTFCTTVEAFGRMRGPVDQESPTACLLEMEGMLAMCTCAEDLVINIWVMQDYKEQVWEARYHIKLLVRAQRWPLCSLQFHGLFKVAVVSERHMLIQFPDADLKLFDIDGKLMGNTRRGAELWYLTSHFLQENINPLPVFGIQQYHGDNEKSPFIRTMHAVCSRTILLLVSRFGWTMLFLVCVAWRYLA